MPTSRKLPTRASSPDSFSDLLLAWYRREQRRLPWRDSTDAYRVWVSEIMLQQTRVEVVIPFFERFVDRFPSVEALAGAAEDDVLALWSGLGYYRRARSLHAGARYLEQHHSGAFPRTLEDALEVPGVGPYTAAAVLSIAYGVPAPVVDGNVERVVSRQRRLRGDPRRAPAKRAIRAIAGDWLAEESAGDFNQALMELGATVCTPRTPRCHNCPVAAHCQAFASGDVDRYPELEERAPPVPVTLHVAVVQRSGRFLLERRPKDALLGDLWMFPFVEGDDFDALREGIERRLGVEATVGVPIQPVRHAITFRRITAKPTIVHVTGRTQRRDRNLRWARAAELGDTLAVSSLAFKILRSLDTASEMNRRG